MRSRTLYFNKVRIAKISRAFMRGPRALKRTVRLSTDRRRLAVQKREFRILAQAGLYKGDR